MSQRRVSRRELILNSGAVVAGATVVHALAPHAFAQQSSARRRQRIKASGYKFKRLQALFDGSVKIEGCDTQWVPGKIGDMNTNVFSGPQTLDVTEIGLHPFMLAYANDKFRDYTLLPVFPLRLFRHKSVFIRTDRNIKRPEDLLGKTIATPGYSSTSLTWIRGIFRKNTASRLRMFNG